MVGMVLAGPASAATVMYHTPIMDGPESLHDATGDDANVCHDIMACQEARQAPSCRAYEWSSGVPTTPSQILGLVVVDPDGCIRQRADNIVTWVEEIVD